MYLLFKCHTSSMYIKPIKDVVKQRYLVRVPRMLINFTLQKGDQTTYNRLIYNNIDCFN